MIRHHGTTALTRRSLLQHLTAAGLLAAARPSFASEPALAQDPILPLGPPRSYDFEGLVDQARALAGRAWTPPPTPARGALAKVDYDAYQRIRFRPEAALYRGAPDAWPVATFHMHAFAPHPVEINLVTDEGARRVRYSAAAFDYTGDLSATDFPDDLGWAGFRVLNEGARPGDWLAFMGASYFRSADPMNQYGLSARGLAIDTTVAGKPEEFPRFTAFWIDQRAEETLVIDALMDSPSLTGAYRIETERGDSTTMRVTSRLFLREAVAQLGVAPLTSMFWFSETNRHAAADWRPEVHDSDGLALWTGAGERLWRPLNNPPSVVTSSFLDTDPRGFGLLQRDRSFANYQDDGVFYERRPSVWVEPLGDWGEGAVQLVEIPTDDEIHDNIVCFWNPARRTSAGDELAWDYRLTWTAAPVVPDELGRCVATRVGRAGVPGQPRPPRGNKIAIDFLGGRLGEFETTDKLEPQVATSRGRIDTPYAVRVVGTEMWRLVFDLYPPEDLGPDEPLELRAFLSRQGEPLTETWIKQHRPVAFGQG